MDNVDRNQYSIFENLQLPYLSDAYLARALLQKQYFPNVRRRGEEFPPFFSTETFTVEAAEALVDCEPRSAEWVELRSRRFDGLIRHLGLPHPVPYARLVLHLRDNWSELSARLNNDRSKIKPEWHQDGRIIQMDYLERTAEHQQHTRLAQGCNYVVYADVSNCFSSIYSHALDWALRGKGEAKKDRRSNGWEANLDKLSRQTANDETKGLIIGPATSNLLSELILQEIDSKLSEFSYVRFIDDYSAYVKSRVEAERFLAELQRQLSHFRLDLNTRKTRVVSLRHGTGSEWMAAVLSHLPGNWNDLDAARFLQHSELLARDYPSVSVLKFAANSILGHRRRPEGGSMMILDELLRMCQFHPHLLPLLSREIALFENSQQFDVDNCHLTLKEQLCEAIRVAETDSIAWIIYIIGIQLERPVRLAKASFRELLELDDDFCWLALYIVYRDHRPRITDHVRGLNSADEGELQSHWLARYELWRVGALSKDDLTDQEYRWMKVLRSHRVGFTRLRGKSLS